MEPTVIYESKSGICRMYSAREAEAMGWINKAVASDHLDQEVDRWAQEILSKSPTAIALAKKMHNVYYDMLSPSMEAGAELLTFFRGTSEAAEGMRAFKEKRRPEFKI